MIMTIISPFLRLRMDIHLICSYPTIKSPEAQQEMSVKYQLTTICPHFVCHVENMEQLVHRYYSDYNDPFSPWRAEVSPTYEDNQGSTPQEDKKIMLFILWED